MKLAQYITVYGGLIGSAVSAPAKRAVSDIDVLNYALTLEHLEDAFYREGLSKFDAAAFAKAGYSQKSYDNLKEVSFDESVHVKFLTSAIEVKKCTYKFGIDSVPAFLTLASILEGVGVTAYLGAAQFVASNAYLTAAGSILTVEARHSTYLRANGLYQRPYPQSFDVPLSFDEVYTLAAPFIIDCPKNNPAFLPLKAFPTLKVTSDPVVLTGSKVTISFSSKAKRQVNITNNNNNNNNIDINIGAGGQGSAGNVYAAFITVTGPVWAETVKAGDGYKVTIPAGVHGQSYLVISSSKQSVTDDSIIAGPAIVEISGTDGAPSLV